MQILHFLAQISQLIWASKPEEPPPLDLATVILVAVISYLLGVAYELAIGRGNLWPDLHFILWVLGLVDEPPPGWEDESEEEDKKEPPKDKGASDSPPDPKP